MLIFSVSPQDLFPFEQCVETLAREIKSENSKMWTTDAEYIPLLLYLH